MPGSASRSDCLAGGNRHGNGAGTTGPVRYMSGLVLEATQCGAEAVQGMLASADCANLDVLGTVSACMCAFTTDNTSIVRGTSFYGRGNVRVGDFKEE